MLKDYSVLILILAIFFISQPEESFCKNPNYYQSIDDKSAPWVRSSTGKILSIRLRRDISLYELITKSGYSIDDEDMVSFLTDFSSMNEDIKSISTLKKDTVVKLPLKNLKKVGNNLLQSWEKSELHAIKRKLIRKKEKEKTDIEVSMITRAMILRNIKLLSDSLDDKILIEAEGFKVLNINERSEISFDTSFFPVIDLNKERVLVLDYAGILPEEIKDIVELTWPEYRVVSNKGRVDLKRIISALLESMGYSVNRDKRIIVGGRTQIEYIADFLIFKKDSDVMDIEICIIGIIGTNEYATPENLVRWLKEKDINLIELTYDETKKIHGKEAEIINIDSDKDVKEFTETMLSLMGYKFSRDNVLSLSDRKEYSYNLKADLSINLGYRTKVIEFVELSDYEINYAQKRGFDVTCIKPWDERKSIINKIMSLLSLNYKNSPRTSLSYITPMGVKYRLLSPGIFVHSIKGPIFITDSEFDPELLRQLIDGEVIIITF